MHFGREALWTEETERRLSKQLKGFVSAETFCNGYRHFADGYVRVCGWESNTRFEGEIGAGQLIYKCRIDFAFLPFSRCSCGEKGSCAHLAAIVCAALFSRGVPLHDFIRKNDLGGMKNEDFPELAEDLLAARQEASAAASPALEAGAASLTMMPPDPKSDSEHPAPWDGYRKWHRLFEQRMPSYAGQPTQYFNAVEFQLLRRAYGWHDAQAGALYRVHALLYAFRLADRTFAGKNYRYGWSQDSLYEMKIELGKALSALEQELRGGVEPADRVAGLLAIVGEYAFAEPVTVADWPDIYRAVWSRFHVFTADMQREKKRLRKLLDESAHPYLTGRLTAGIVHMHQLEDGPEAATKYLLEHWQAPPGYYYSYLDIYRRSENWPYLRIWLEALRDLAAAYGDEEDVQTLLEFWGPLADATLPRENRADELARFLAALLPTAFHPYAAVLLKQQDYRRWADLHLAYRELPDDSDGYAVVKRRAPELLLPVYHLFAEEWIEERKRDSYRAAVLHLKRLRELYGQLKRPDRWNDYAAKLVARYPRLKALHEEMRKEHLWPK